MVKDYLNIPHRSVTRFRRSCAKIALQQSSYHWMLTRWNSIDFCMKCGDGRTVRINCAIFLFSLYISVKNSRILVRVVENGSTFRVSHQLAHHRHADS